MSRTKFNRREENMPTLCTNARCCLAAIALVTMVSLTPAKVADLNPAAIAYKLPDQIPWTDESIGAKIAILHGDPTNSGPYTDLVRGPAQHMSHPPSHPNDRFITVLSGTWWV